MQTTVCRSTREFMLPLEHKGVDMSSSGPNIGPITGTLGPTSRDSRKAYDFFFEFPAGERKSASYKLIGAA